MSQDEHQEVTEKEATKQRTDEQATTEQEAIEQKAAEQDVSQMVKAASVSVTSVTPEEEELEAQVAFQTIKRRREERKRRRIIIIVAASAAALVALIVFISSRVNQAADSATVDPFSITGEVRTGDFQNTIKVNGATNPGKTTIVTPEVDGIIENLQVSEGDYVNEGDVLFTMKNDDVDKTVRDADAAVQSAQDEVDKANRAVDDAYAAYNNAVDIYNATNNGEPFDDSAVRSGITAAEDAYNEAVKALNNAQSARDETVAKADKRTVRAPASGTLVSLTAVNGAKVNSGNVSTGSSNTTQGPLAQISDLSQMKVVVQVNESDVTNISVGQEGTATFPAISGLSLPAKVEHISSISSGSSDSGSASSSSGSASVVTYPVDLVIPNPDPRIKSGMTATVKIVTQNIPNTTIVPVAAVSDDGNGGSQVVVVDNAANKEVHTVAVEVLGKNTSDAAVKGDLKDGDKVMLTSADLMGSSASSSAAA